MSLPPDTGAVELISFKQHIIHLLAERQRLDGRPFTTIRTPHILHDIIGGTRPDAVLAATLYSDNSGTCVNCTVGGVFGPPPPLFPHEGRLTVDVAAPFLTSGAAGEEALREVARFVQTVLEATIDLTTLGILNGEACWVLRLELTVMNADGGLRAAALHAATAALYHLTLPRARLPNGEVAEARQLQFHHIPVAVTIGICAGVTGGTGGVMHILMDTSAAEESVADGLITIALDEKDSIVALLHHGRIPLLASVLGGVIDAFASQSAMLRSVIVKSCNSTVESKDK